MGAADIWVLYGRHSGDNRQMAALAEATGLGWEPRKLAFGPLAFLPPFLLPPTAATLTRAARAGLTGPWPKYVIAAGGKSVAAARWIRRRSGGAARLIMVGRPWTRLSLFDLVVTTPQYGLPASRPNVVRNLFILGAGGRAADGARDDLLALPQPRVGVIVGGDSRPLKLDPATAGRLARAALARAERDGGSVIAVTSPRTSPEAAAAIESALAVAATPSRLFCFGEDTSVYREVLACADRFLVTGDSASMISEAAATGAPVDVFPLPQARDLRLRLKDFGCGLLELTRLGRFLRARLEAAGAIVATRDLAAYAGELRAAGLLDGGEAAPCRAEAELLMAAARLRRLAEPRTEPARAPVAVGLPRGRRRLLEGARPAS